MNTILITLGLLFSFIGTFFALLEILLGLRKVKREIYVINSRKAYEADKNGRPIEVKLTKEEIRLIIYLSLIFIGFVVQLFGSLL